MFKKNNYVDKIELNLHISNREKIENMARQLSFSIIFDIVHILTFC